MTDLMYTGAEFMYAQGMGTRAELLAQVLEEARHQDVVVQGREVLVREGVVGPAAGVVARGLPPRGACRRCRRSPTRGRTSRGTTASAMTRLPRVRMMLTCEAFLSVARLLSR